MSRFLILLAACCCLFGAHPAAALRFYVDGSPAANDTTPPVGDDRRSLQSAQDSSTPLKTITQALNLAHLISEGRPHVIQITPGTYSPSRGETFPLVVTDPNVFMEATGLTVFDAEGLSNHIEITAPTSDFLLNGIDFINGVADSGGVIQAKTCSLRVVNCRFFDNRATAAGHIIYSQDGRLRFFNNVVRNNGSFDDTTAVVEIHHTFADTSKRDRIRNNTFYRNSAPAILSSGNRADISSNIFLDPGTPALRDLSAAEDPLLRYNLFWEASVLYISDKSDTIQIAKASFDTLKFSEVGISVPTFVTVAPPVKTLLAIVDTVTLEELGVRVPAFVTNVPDTLATVNQPYSYTIAVSGDTSLYGFKGVTLPTTASAQTLEQNRRIDWTPTLNDTGRTQIKVEITAPGGSVDTLEYHVAVFTVPNFPDTTIFIPVLNDTGRTIGMATEDIRIEVPHTAGENYNFKIEVEGNRSAYNFNPLILPAGVSSADVDNLGEINWSTTLADTGSNRIQVEIIDPTGNLGTLDYKVRVFSAAAFPDTSMKGDVITATVVQDTTSAINALNALLPSFSSAASAGGNLFANPTFLDTTINRFELVVGSPALDAGNPVVALRDGTVNRNDIGNEGGPAHAGAPTPGSFAELKISSLPDSLATEGVVYDFDITLDPSTSVNLVDLLQGPPTMAAAFGQKPPIQWTPTIADTGAFQVGVIVFTNSGEGRQYYPLRVRPLNDNPVIGSSPGLAAFEDSLYSYSLSATDANGDTLSFSLVDGPQAMTVDSTSGLLQWLPTQADIGSVAVSVRADDGKGGFASQQFTLQVANTNDLPQLTSTPDSAAVEDVLFSYTVTATDSDPADTLSYSVTAGPAAAAIDTAGLFTWTPLQADVGTQQFTVRVADQNGGAATQSFPVVVAEIDDPPVISSTPDTVASEDLFYSYALSAIDEEGGQLTFELTSGPVGMSIDTTGTVEWTPVASDIGTQTVEIQIRDPGGLQSTQSFQLQVLAVNDLPVINQRSPADTLIIANAGAATAFSANVTDEENDTILFAWLVDGSVQTGATANSFSYTPGAASIDTVTLRAIDSADTTSTLWIVDSREIARVSVVTDTIDFGDVGLGNTTETTLTVSNAGRVALEISDLSLGNLQFGASFGTATVGAGGETTLEILFSPTARGSIQSQISFATNDPDRASISIPLRSRGVVPTVLALDLDPASGSQGLSTVAVAPGATVSVAVYAASALQLVSYDLLLRYDPDILAPSSFSINATGENNLLEVIGNTVTGSSSSPDGTTFSVSAATQAGASGVTDSGLLGVATFVVSSAVVPAGQTTPVDLVQALLKSADQSIPDTLTDAAQAEVTLQSGLQGDFNLDAIVNFDDFFLFADHFGTTSTSENWDPVYDLNQLGSSSSRIDFDDFFIFADGFGAAEKRMPQAEAPASLRLVSELEKSTPDRVEVGLLWQGSSPIRGFVVTLEYDASVLSFRAYQPAPEREPLPWVREATGQVSIAVGIGADEEPFAGGDLGNLEFERLKRESTTLQAPAAISYNGESSTVHGAPPPLEIEELPSSYLLFPPFPNPFNPETVVRFFLPEPGAGSVRVYDLLGRRVTTLASGELTAGYHRLKWSGRDEGGREVGAGVYLVLLDVGKHQQVRKLMLLK
jgi:hypothetical protein